MLEIYNSFTQKKEKFETQEPGHAKMYVCGPTVYSYLHVGNFRGPVFFNLVRNWLEFLNYKVTYALNFTDVDDKIIQRAEIEGLSPSALAEKYIREYKIDFESLGLKPQDINPRVTESMDEILQMVEDLVKMGKAYESHGDVLFHIDSFESYGDLSGRKTDDLLVGVRKGPDEKKKNPLDFALWKSAKEGEPFWSSPYGGGRPGWHIECSAMIRKYFGDFVDIHGGGIDLLFPHHENEKAQSEACSGKPFVRYWMHNNLLNFGGQKMSKSLGNVVTLREFLQLQDAEIYKWMILSVHYRSVSDFSEVAVDRAVLGLSKVYSALSIVQYFIRSPEAQLCLKEGDLRTKTNIDLFDSKSLLVLKESWSRVETALNNDFGTPEVFAVIFEVIRKLNTEIKRSLPWSASIESKALVYGLFFKLLGKILCLFEQPPEAYLKNLEQRLLDKKGLSKEYIENLVFQRGEARGRKDFKTSDEIRTELFALGILVMDTSEGSFWEVDKSFE